MQNDILSPPLRVSSVLHTTNDSDSMLPSQYPGRDGSLKMFILRLARS